MGMRENPGGMGLQTSRARLLLAEDDPLIRSLLMRGLAAAGYTVVDVTTGEEALQAARAAPFDLGVFDLVLPGMSGLDAARQINEETGLPFVVLSAHGEESVVAEAVEAGALGFLLKPLEVTQIVPGIEAAIRRAADMRRMESTEEQLSAALAQTREISIAIGLVMGRKNISREAAFDHLRARARRERRKLAELAGRIVLGVEEI